MRSVVLQVGMLLLSLSCVGIAQETTYTPEGDVRPTNDKVEIKNLRLLASQDLFGRNVDVQKLADFTKTLRKSVSESVPAAAPGFELLVKVTLSPRDKPKYEMSSDGKAADDLLQAIYDGLQKQPDVRVKTDLLSFEIAFTIKPKS